MYAHAECVSNYMQSKQEVVIPLVIFTFRKKNHAFVITEVNARSILK